MTAMPRLGLVLLLAASTIGAPAAGQAPARKAAAPRSGPRIPGAVTRPPAWLVEKAPFDMAKFFEAPPPDRNAAPIYLDALLEFAPEAADCFPEGAATARRKQVATDRQRRWQEISEALQKDPNAVPAATIDALLTEHEAGFRKLAEAQRRPACVFQTGIGIDALVPHAQAARQVVRIVQLRTRRDLARRDFDRPIHDVETVLRLCRDLRPRGYLICQIVTVAMANVCYNDVVGPILAAPGLRREHGDRLLKVLADHQAKAIDPMAEALKAEYLTQRSLIRNATGRAVGRNNDRAGAARLQRKNVEDLVRQAANGQPINAEAVRSLLAELGRVSDADYDALIERLNTLYRDLAGLSGKPYAERTSRAEAILESFPRDRPAAKLTVLALPRIPLSEESFTRIVAADRATACLVALRRWQLTAKEPPTDLAAIVQAAGMPAVPIDPYDGKPLRLTNVEGAPIIYSVGKDQRDDGGLVDSKYNQQPGDLIFKIPMPPTKAKAIR